MSDRVDELFGGGGPAPPPVPVNPLRGLRALVITCAVLNLIGPFTFLSVPAALLTIWAWYQADEAVRKARVGLLDGRHAQDARKLRRLAFGLLLMALSLLLAQIVLYTWLVDRAGESAPPTP